MPCVRIMQWISLDRVATRGPTMPAVRASAGNRTGDVASCVAKSWSSRASPLDFGRSQCEWFGTFQWMAGSVDHLMAECRARGSNIAKTPCKQILNSFSV